MKKMSEDTISEDICREKISLEFGIFCIQKKEELNGELREWNDELSADAAARGKQKEMLKDALDEKNKEFREFCRLSRENVIGIYNRFTQKKEYDMCEGFFRARAKCRYCARFLEGDYQTGTNKYTPCDKIKAQRKLRQKTGLDEKDKAALERGHLECEDKFEPMIEKEELNAALDLLEREHRIIIEAWKKQVYAKIASDNL